MSLHLYLASSNKDKLRDISEIFEPYHISIELLEKVVGIEENSNNLLDNAIAKSVSNSKVNPDKLILSTDGGVKIPYLGDNWNHVMTRRLSGKDLEGKFTDLQRCETILEMMKEAKGEDRAIYWHEAFAISRNGKVLYTFEGNGEKGYFTDRIPDNFAETGFSIGYIWFEPRFNKTYMELTKEEKHSYEMVTTRLAKDLLKKISLFQ